MADKDPDAPGFAIADHALPIDLNDCDSLIRAVTAAGGINGVVSMSEVGVRAAARISAALALPSISEDAAANATSKAAMRRQWATTNYSTGFEGVSTLDEATVAVEKLQHFPLIFKPDRSYGGSRGVGRVESCADVANAFRAAQDGGLPNTSVVIEYCVEGTEHSAELLIWQGKTSLLCVGQKVKSRRPYRVDVSVQYPAELSAQQEAIVAQMCHDAASSLRITQGVAHLEFAYTDHGPVLFELGARCGGGHTPQIAHHVSGVNEFVEACRMACGEPPSQFVPTTRRGADYRFLAFPPGVADRVDIPAELHTDSNILDVGITVRAGDMIQPLRSTSDRAGFVVSLGESLSDAVSRADRACLDITAHYADGTSHKAADLVEFRELARS